MEFLKELLLQAIGPLVTAVVGTLIIGTFVAWITRKAQERRAENQLRIQLIDHITETASVLYMATQNFWRKKEREKVDNKELVELRKELDQQYLATRVAGEVIERRLEAYFISEKPKAFWHATMDLLTIRYFHLIGLATDELRKRNEGEEHTGLSAEQLKDQGLVLETYREKLKKAANAVMQEPFKPLTN